MGHIGLIADNTGHADHLEQLHILPPRMHAAPADLALGDQELAMLLCNLAGRAERLGDTPGIAFRFGIPRPDADRGIDAHTATGTNADIAHPSPDTAGLLDLAEEAADLRIVTH